MSTATRVNILQVTVAEAGPPRRRAGDQDELFLDYEAIAALEAAACAAGAETITLAEDTVTDGDGTRRCRPHMGRGRALVLPVRAAAYPAPPKVTPVDGLHKAWAVLLVVLSVLSVTLGALGAALFLR